MTYRRLFLWLSAASTLVLVAMLAGASWQAGRQPHLLKVHGLAESASYTMAVVPGTFVIQYDCGVDHPAKGRDSGYLDVVALPTLAPGTFSFELEPFETMGGGSHPLLGDWGMTGEIEQSDFDDPVWFGAYSVVFPVWLPWLVFIACAFLACRRMERRAGTMAEKRLAEEEAADRVSGP